MKNFSRIFAPLVAMALALPAQSHEFWISPLSYQVPVGDTILADLRVGQNFSGSAFPFVTRSITLFDVATPSDRMPVPGRMGDRPAAQVPTTESGLHVLIHETTDNTVSYTELEKFDSFVTHKDQRWALAEHEARGFPTDRFTETYRRYAKSLIAVGDGAGSDARAGLHWELVALTNPYTDDLSQGFQVQLWRDDQPVGDTQIELFALGKTDEAVISLHRTNADGIATLMLDPATEYLVDAVELIARDPLLQTGAEWHSNWAALTFKTPG